MEFNRNQLRHLHKQYKEYERRFEYLRKQRVLSIDSRSGEMTTKFSEIEFMAVAEIGLTEQSNDYNLKNIGRAVAESQRKYTNKGRRKIYTKLEEEVFPNLDKFDLEESEKKILREFYDADKQAMKALGTKDIDLIFEIMGLRLSNMFES